MPDLRTANITAILLAGTLLRAVPQAHAAVTFEGLGEPLERNARALVALASASCTLPDWRIERLYENADDELEDALRALGYYRYTLAKSLDFGDPECWSATLRVELGEPVRLANVTVVVNGEARTDATFVDLLHAAAPAPGDVLDHGRYDSWKRLALSSLTARGYFDARLTRHTVVVDESLASADVVLELDSGARYQFGEIEYENPVLDEELLGKYATFSPGDPYDASEIARLYESLNGSGYFGAVSIRAEPAAGQERIVPVFVSLSPGKRRVYSAGVGYATDYGVQGRLGYTNRRRNARGHQFDARLFLSDVDSELTGTYRWPRGDPTKEWVDVFGGFQQRRTDTSRSDKTTLGIRVTRNRGPNWLEAPYVHFSGEDFTVGDQVDSSRLIMPGVKWESTIGREITRILSGRRLSLDIRGANQDLGSDTSFLQATASAKWVFSRQPENRLLVRADVGFTNTDEVERLPATVRYFAGGDNSVRGYGFETIGPLDDQGNVIGGSNLATISLEYDRLIRGNWSAALFVDSGTAYIDTNVDFKTGVGLGLRWYSPFGPIRIDVAHPLDDPTRSVRLHLTLGPDL